MKRMTSISLYIFIVCCCYGNLYSDTETSNNPWKPRLVATASLTPVYNINTGLYKATNNNNICCNDLKIDKNYFSFAFEIGIKALMHNLYNIPVFDSLSYNITTSFNYSYNKILGSNFEPFRKVLWQNELTDLIEKNEIAIYSSTLYWFINFELGSPFVNLNYYTNPLTPKFYFSLGPIIGFTLDNYYEQTLSIIKPEGFLYSNGKNSTKNTFNDFAGFNGFVLGLNVNFDLYWNLSKFLKNQWSKNMDVGAGLRYVYLISSLVSNQSIDHSNIAFKFNMVYYFPN